MTQPLLSELHRQGHELSVAALPWVAPVYEAMQECSKLMVLPFVRGKLELLQRRQWAQSIYAQYDRAYVCPNTFKSALLVVGAGIPERIGYQGEMRWGLLNHRLPNPSKSSRQSMVHFYLALAGVDALHGQGPETRVVSPFVAPSPQLQLPLSFQNACLERFQLVTNSYITLAPGAEYGEAKRWPKERFIELMMSIRYPVVLLGSRADQGLCEEMVQALQAKGFDHVRNLAGHTQLKEAMALIASSKGLVSNDSGLMHIAAALGVRQIALFGSSSAEHTPALSSKAQMIWLKWDPAYAPALDCAPCFKRTCPLGHQRCLWDISAQRVAQMLKDW